MSDGETRVWSDHPEVRALIARVTDVVWDAYGGCASGKKALLHACGIQIPRMPRPHGTGATYNRDHMQPSDRDPDGKIGGWHGEGHGPDGAAPADHRVGW